ncbi:MAG: hypothetical protein IT323_19440 [Anaerolineae bacterium]|nr:hypothetical protein [Anaerolineae bacterium]
MFKRIAAWACVLIAVLGMMALPVGRVQDAAAQGGPLSAMLARVPDDEAAHTVLWYGSLSDLERVLGVQIDSLDAIDQLPPDVRVNLLWEFGSQVYYSPFSGLDNPSAWASTFGLNSFNVDRELTVGADLPDQYGILEGQFDAGALAGVLATLGYQPTQVGGQTVYALGADNASDAGNAAQYVAGPRYNRLLVTPDTIIAAPSTARIQPALEPGPRIADDPAYAALALALENADTGPDSLLLSAALFGGETLADNARAAADEAMLSAPLPAYTAAGFGYRRGETDRSMVLALAYADQAAAEQAVSSLAARLPNYTSAVDPGRRLFDGWEAQGNVVAGPGGVFVATIIARLPDQTDVSWIGLVRDRDLGFLAVN